MSAIRKFILGISVTLFTLFPAIVSAQDVSGESLSIGEREFESSCAICHGTGGKGNGMWKDMLLVKPSDLTLLAKNNRGVFPFERVYAVIDGRADIKYHGTREMPVWGDVYNADAIEYYSDYYRAYDPETFVRARILALISYIGDIQQ